VSNKFLILATIVILPGEIEMLSAKHLLEGHLSVDIGGFFGPLRKIDMIYIPVAFVVLCTKMVIVK